MREVKYLNKSKRKVVCWLVGGVGVLLFLFGGGDFLLAKRAKAQGAKARPAPSKARPAPSKARPAPSKGAKRSPRSSVPARRRASAASPKGGSLSPALRDLLGHFPARSQVVFFFSDLTTLRRAWKTTPLHQLSQEKEIKPLVRWVGRRFLGTWQGRRRRKRKSLWASFRHIFQRLTAHTPRQAAQIFDGPHAMTLVNLPRGSEPLALGAVLRFQRKDKEKARQIVEKILQRIPAKRSSYRQGKVQVQVLRGMENAFHYALLADRYLWSSTRSLMVQLIEKEKARSKNLLQSKEFRRFVRQAYLGKGAALYVSSRLLRLLLTRVRRHELLLWKMLGITEWGTLGMTATIDKGRFVTRWYVARSSSPKTHRAPNKNFTPSPKARPSPKKSGSTAKKNRYPLATPPRASSLWSSLPTRPVAVALLQIPWAKLWDDLWGQLQEEEPRLHRRLKRYLVMAERGVLNFEVGALLKALGEEALFVFYPYPDGGLLPQGVALFQLKNPALIRKALFQLARLLRASLQSFSYHKAKCYRFRLKRHSFRRLPYRFRYQLRPLLQVLRHLAFAFDGQRLVVAYQERTLRTFLDLQQQKTSPALKKLRASLARQAQGKRFFVWSDARSLLAGFYNTFLALPPGKRWIRRLLGMRGLDFSMLPRSQSFLRYMKPGSFSLEIGRKTLGAEMHTGFGAQIWLLGAATARLVRRSLGQYSLRRYLRDIRSYVLLEEASKGYAQSKQYALAYNRWRRLARGAVLEAVIMSARKKSRHFQKLYESQRAKVLRQLASAYSKQGIASWEIHGDWTWKEGVLSGRTGKRTRAALVFGATDLSHYVLEFEVQQPRRRLTVGLHVAESGRSPHRRPMQRISFPARRFAKGTWVPVQIKVKGRRIRYWFGMRHRIIRSYRHSGQIALLVPWRDALRLRKLRLTLPASKKRARKGRPYPSLRLSLSGTQSAVEVGSMASYTLRIQNQGQVAARRLKVRLTFSSQIGRVSAYQPGVSGREKKWKPPHNPSQPRQWALIPSLGPGKTLRVVLRARARAPGSGWVRASVSFAGLPGEVVVEQRTHFLPPTSP